MKKYQGVAPDKRSKKEKKKDWDAKELLAGSVPTFRVVNSISEIKKGVLRDQNGSGSCTTQAIAKAIEMAMVKFGYEKTEINRVISATYHYQNRSNRPASGSNPQEMLEWIRKNGFYKEADVPSQKMTDYAMDSYKIAESVKKKTNYELNYFLDMNPQFEQMAQYVEQYGNATLWIMSDYNSYVKDIPNPVKRSGDISHMVCIVDSITLGGVKYLVMDESWGNVSNTELGERGQRLLTKEAFNIMKYQAQVSILTKKAEGKIDYSKYQNITKNNYRDRSVNILNIQEMLKEGGYMSKNIDTINYDKKGNKYGYYGDATADAVLKWQLDNITSVSAKQLKNWKGHYFGNASLQVIKSKVAGDTPVEENMENIKFRWDKFILVLASAFVSYLVVVLANPETALETLGIPTILTPLLHFVFQAIDKYLKDIKG